MAQAEGAEKAACATEWNELFKIVHSEKLGEMAAEFDRIHSVHRALEVGALNHIIPPATLRPYLIDAVKRGIGTKSASAGREKETALPVSGEPDECVLAGTDASGRAIAR